MVRFYNPFSKRKIGTTQLELKKREIESQTETIRILEAQRKSITDGHKVVVDAYNKALDLDDHIIDRYDIAHKEQLVEKKPLPIKIPKGGADISDVLENLVSEGEFEIPFLGKKGKGMIVAMIRKNKEMINEKAEGIMNNAIENAAQQESQIPNEEKADNR